MNHNTQILKQCYVHVMYRKKTALIHSYESQEKMNKQTKLNYYQIHILTNL